MGMYIITLVGKDIFDVEVFLKSYPSFETCKREQRGNGTMTNHRGIEPRQLVVKGHAMNNSKLG